MLRIIKIIINKLIDFLLYFISKKIFQIFFDFLIHFALKCKGYKNFGDFNLTGEYNFLKIIKKHNLKLSIDIGANIGEFSKKILDITGSNVIAFEPEKYSFKKLKKIEKIYPNKFNSYNFALSDHNKLIDFYSLGKSSQLSSIEKNVKKLNYVDKSKIKKKKIKCFKGDFFFNKFYKNKKIDYIKIDAEGHDYNVLLGLKSTISKSRTKFIQFEMNWHNLFSNYNVYKIASEFKKYDLYRILPYKSGLLKVDIHHPNNNLFHLSNFVLVRKDIKIV